MGYLPDALVNYLARNPGMRDKYLNDNELPAGLMDLTWIPGYKAFFEDANGVKLGFPHTRSYNMSSSIHCDYATSYTNYSEIDNPPTSQLFVFIDVHEAEILDSLFGVLPPGWSQLFRMREVWWDLPANRHNQGCNLSFADGHMEHWRWTAPKIFKKMGQDVDGEGDRKDFRRLQGGVRPETRF